MTSWVNELRHACRRLLRTPLFTTVAVLTIGVGIGATTAIFSVVYGVLLKPLPFPEPERLVGVWHTAPGLNDLRSLNMGPSNYFVYRESSRVFQDVGVWNNRSLTVTGLGDPERLDAIAVTDGILPILGVKPLLGRLFTKEDDRPGVPRRTVLTHGYWQRRFGGAHDVVGQSLTLDGRPCEIIGVLPPAFVFPPRPTAALVIPLQFDRNDVRIGQFSFIGIARLKPGVTIEDANRDLGRMIPLLLERFPLPQGFTRAMFEAVRIGPDLHPLTRDIVGDVGRVLWILLAVVGIVLLIACANVANLFLVRAEGRQQELALRAALGASRGRIARTALAESLTLACVGGVLGLLLARAGIGLLAYIAPSGLPRLHEIGLHPMVLLFTVVVSLVAGLLFGIIPVLRFGTPSIAALKEGGRSTSDGPERHRARNVLVVAEIALALVLLIVSGLMIRTFVALRHVEPGFVRPEEVQTFRVSVPEALVKDPEQTMRLFQQIGERIGQVPGVSAVGACSSITMDGRDNNDPIFVEDHPVAGDRMPPIRRYKMIAPGCLETLGNRLLAGRAITWTDIYQRAPVVLVSENLAREYFREPSAAIGKRIRHQPGAPWREIVGVVGNERDNGVQAAAPTIVFWPMLLSDFYTPNWVSRTVSYAVRTPRIGSPTLLRELQQAVWSVNPNLPLANVLTLDEIRAASMAQTSFALVMLAIAAAVALLLGIVGIYGVIAYIAAQRTREIGIRMALGAQVGDVSRLFLRYGLWLTAAGVSVGVGVAVLLTRLMTSLLFGVDPVDPLTYVAVSAGLGGVALLATYLPARRASRIDPIVALRSDA